MYQGSCLCGGVRYQLNGKLGPVVCCHCADCRKAQGTAFATVAPVRTADFRLLAGEELLSGFESSPGKKRMFCARCGSPIYSQRAADPDTLRLRVGTIDEPDNVAISAHIWTGAKAPWYDICDGAPQYEKFEPNRAPGTSGGVPPK